jgi:2,3-bisphosphoglycerate-independent phosphoglycerate mutase
LIEAINKANGILIVTADHGNSDDMFQRDKKSGEIAIDEQTGKPKPKTAHSLNPVPIYIYDPTAAVKMRLSGNNNLGISNIAATCLTLLGFEPPKDYTPSIIEIE